MTKAKITDLDAIIEEAQQTLASIKGASEQLKQLSVIHSKFSDMTERYGVLNKAVEENQQEREKYNEGLKTLEKQNQDNRKSHEEWLIRQERRIEELTAQRDEKVAALSRDVQAQKDEQREHAEKMSMHTKSLEEMATTIRMLEGKLTAAQTKSSQLMLGLIAALALAAFGLMK